MDLMHLLNCALVTLFSSTLRRARCDCGVIFPSVLRPGPARRVDPGPGRPGPGTGPGEGKNPLGN